MHPLGCLTSLQGISFKPFRQGKLIQGSGSIHERLILTVVYRGKDVILDASTWYLPTDICLFIHGRRNVTYGRFNVVVQSRTYKQRFGHYKQPPSPYLWLPETLSLWRLDGVAAVGTKARC